MTEPTEAERAMIHALAEAVLLDRMTKTRTVVGVTKSGRIVTERCAPPTPAELKWAELQAKFDTGGYKPREM